MPVGSTPREQTLVRLRKREDGSIAREDLGPVRFVPLIGAGGWSEPAAATAPAVTRRKPQVSALLAEAGEPFTSVADADLGPLLERIGDARVVLLGEATHGTSEFYSLRARVTQELVARHGFRIVAAEADWPDAARVDRWLRGQQEPAGRPIAFTRFPSCSHGEHNIGHLCRRHFGTAVYNIGFGTDHGTVMAADNWDEPGRVMKVRPARSDSYEGAAHPSEVPTFFLPLREPRGPSGAEARDALLQPRLERAIGVIYRPQTELQSHYFEAYLPAQFDEWVWFDETAAVTPLPTVPSPGVPETYPFGV